MLDSNKTLFEDNSDKINKSISYNYTDSIDE